MAKVDVIHEVELGSEGEWRLCFQWGKYRYDDGGSDFGYRFIWKDSGGNQKPQRGQARIPDAKDLFLLLSRAAEEGWLGSCESK